MSYYLSGSVTSDDVLAAYQAIGAASQAASYLNLNNPGTNDLTVPSVAPGWTSGGGWSFLAASQQYMETGALALSHEVSAVFAYTDALFSIKTPFGYQDAGTTKFGATFSLIDASKITTNFSDVSATYNTSLTSGIVAITSAGRSAYVDNGRRLVIPGGKSAIYGNRGFGSIA